MFMLFAREQDHSSPWLTGSNFKHKVLSRQILVTSKTQALRKDDLARRGRREKTDLSLLPFFPSTTASVCLSQECPDEEAGRYQGSGVVPWSLKAA